MRKSIMMGAFCALVYALTGAAGPQEAHAAGGLSFAPNPPAYGQRTVVTAYPGRGARDCTLDVLYRMRPAGVIDDDSYAHKNAGPRGAVSWVWHPTRTTVTMPTTDHRTQTTTNRAQVVVSCGRWQASTLVTIAAGVGRSQSSKQVLYRFWQDQMQSGSRACFGHVSMGQPAYMSDVEQILNDCTIGFSVAPPPDSLAIDPRVQHVYQLYLQTAQDEAAFARSVMATGAMDWGSYRQAGQDLDAYNNAMGLLSEVYG